MRRKLIGSENTQLFSPLLDVLMNVVGAIIVLLLIVILLINPPQEPERLQFLKTSVPVQATAGQEFIYAFPVVGGTGERFFTLDVERGLPSGLSFDSQTGTIFGTPQQESEGSVQRTFTATVSDSTGTDILAGQLVIHETAVPYSSGEHPLRLPIRADSGSPVALPPGRAKRPYSATLSALGGVEPYEWSISEGELPPGLSIDGDGRITGTPTASGNYPFRVQLTHQGGSWSYRDAIFHWVGGETSARYSITIWPELSPRWSAGIGRVGEPFSGSLLSPSPMLESVTWEGDLPPGLSASLGGWVLAGRPREEGTFPLVATVGGTEPIPVEITILPKRPSLTVGGVVVQVWAGDSVDASIPYGGAHEPVRIEVSELPDGLTVQDSRIVGTTQELGLHRVPVTLVDATGRTAIGSVVLRVGGRY